MDHRLASLKFITSTGLIPVKVRPGQKDPFPEWDPRVVAAQDHTAVIKELQHNRELNLGALFFGKYVDIDVDANSPMLSAALDWFLPMTPYIWGRESKPRSHRVYALHDDFDRALYGPVLRYMKDGLKDGKVDEYSYSIEVRGGKPENGLFSVLPGSVHPSGEKVRWDENIDPTIGGSFVALDQLIRCIRLAIVASILVPHWGPGVRNDMSLALAGTLWRIRSAAMAAFNRDPDEDNPENFFILTYEDAEQLFKCIMELSGDQHGDEKQRLLNLRNSWRKLESESGAKVTGGRALAELINQGAGESSELGQRAVRALYRLLSDSDAAETIEKLSEQYVMWYGPGVIIDLGMVQNNRSNPWMNREQAKNSLAGKNVTIRDEKVPITAILFGSSIIHRVAGLTFDPSTTDLVVNTPEGAMVNQWRGFATKPSDQRITAEEIEPFITYVREVVANGNEEHAHWVFAWLADILKNPDRKPGTALVLVGVEGAGKTFLGERVMGRIIGPTHYGQTNSISTLTHNFNTIIDNKLFLQCDEAIHSYQKDVASRLKSIITDEKIIIEPKGINSYTKPNHMRFLFTSNEEGAAIFISPSPYERRFTVLRVSPRRARDEKYWQMMHLWTPTALPKIMRWLIDYQYDRWLVMRPLDTEAKRVIQKVGFDTELSWICSRIASGFPVSDKIHEYWFQAYHEDTIKDKDKRENLLRRDDWPNRIMLQVLEEDYKAFCRGMGKSVYSGSVRTTIQKVLPPGSMVPLAQLTVRYVEGKSGKVVQGRVRIQSFPSAEDIIEHLRGRYGAIVDEALEKYAPDPVVVDASVKDDAEREF